MNFSSLQFPLIAVALLALALVVLNVVNGAPIEVYAAFVPLLVWAGVIVLRNRAASNSTLDARGRRDKPRGRR